ncbi:MAG: prenyltransferase [Chloroflexi bacterium]|nr:prenyltransferase [Chloroflexota bacterium]
MNQENPPKKFHTVWKLFLSDFHTTELSLSIALFLFGAVFCYYAGYKVDIFLVAKGLLVILFFLVGMELLNLIFTDDHSFETILVETYGVMDYRLIFYILAAVSIGVGTVITVFQIREKIALILAGTILLLIFFYTIKPFRFIYSGYGELLHAFLVGFLIPGFGYSIMAGSRIPLTLVYLCLPLFFIILAHLYLKSNRTLPSDIEKYRTTAAMRFGSVVTLRVVVYLIVFSYILVLLLGVDRLPWRFVLRWYFSIPVGVYLIWLVNQVLAGEKGNWTSIRFLSTSLVLLNVALLISSMLFL